MHLHERWKSHLSEIYCFTLYWQLITRWEKNGWVQSEITWRKGSLFVLAGQKMNSSFCYFGFSVIVGSLDSSHEMFVFKARRVWFALKWWPCVVLVWNRAICHLHLYCHSRELANVEVKGKWGICASCGRFWKSDVPALSSSFSLWHLSTKY